MKETLSDLEKRVARGLERRKYESRHTMPNKTRRVGKIEKYFLHQQSDLPDTVFIAEKIRFPDKPKEYEIRLGYWVISTKPNSKKFGTWVWGQFCPLLPPADMKTIYKKMEDLGWLNPTQK